MVPIKTISVFGENVKVPVADPSAVQFLRNLPGGLEILCKVVESAHTHLLC
jgi:hypothetical protein